MPSPVTLRALKRKEPPETILIPEVFVNAKEMDIEKSVKEAVGTEAAPSGCPDGSQYIPRGMRVQLI